MAIAYQPPGVFVSELVSPSVNPLLAAPANACLVGAAQGYIQRTDQVALTNVDNVPLPNFPQGNASLSSVLSVASITNPEVLTYDEGSDFVINYSTPYSEVQLLTVEGTGGTFTLSFQDETTDDIRFDNTYEAQTITIDADAGTYTLTFEGDETVALAWNAADTLITSELEALPSIGAGNVVVSGVAAGPYDVAFGGDLTGSLSLLVADDSTLELDGGDPGSGTATITRNTVGNQHPDDIQAALEALSNIAPGDVTVTGDDDGPWTISFGGTYTNQDVPTLVGDDQQLTGVNALVTVDITTEGGQIATVRRVTSGAIEEGETVTVVYRYIPTDYFLPTRLDEQSSVEDRYGPSLNENGSIRSEVSFAASCAFENGAQEVIIQPLFRRTDANDPDSVKRVPTAAESQSATTWEQTLYALRDIEDINVIVPVAGQGTPGLIDAEWLAIAQKVQAHIKWMRDQQQYVVGIVGEDSSTSNLVAQKATLIAHAQTLQSWNGGVIAEQMVFVSPSKFTRVNPQTARDFYVGGQYVAAGIAGMLAGRAVSASITRSVISGFTGVADPRSKADKNRDAQNGLLVVEQRGPVIQVRHGVTLDTTATARRELPVVRAKHRMIESLRDTIDTQIIGQVIADGEAPSVVAAAVASVLESLKALKDLVDYKNIQARTLTLDPTTVEVRFSYKPAFPLNYVNVVFSIDLTTGSVTGTV